MTAGVVFKCVLLTEEWRIAVFLAHAYISKFHSFEVAIGWHNHFYRNE